ncbi:hypothetical protein LUZ60_010877 [Juncus effusus]|nr:hypothetical protein LUZ60_010877 [Juncus effusus]
MLRLAVRRAVSQTFRNPEPVISSPSPLRLLSTNAAAKKSQPERIAGEMIRYALVDGRTRSSGDWREESMRILEQGVSNLENGEQGSRDAVGLLMLAMSTLLYERGKYQDAMEKLEAIHQKNYSLPLKVASWEGLMGVKMETEQDVNYSVSADDYFLTKGDLNILKLRENSIKGFAALLNGEIESAKSFFDECQDFNTNTYYNQIENALLSYGEYLHSIGNFNLAREMYEKCIEKCDEINVSREYSLSGANMVPEETYLASVCSLGQLLSHTGKMNEAEEMLTKALTSAETHFGKSHPKVGVVLTCIAKMYKEKAKLEGSSSIIVQEGLYRKALDILKAPDLNSEANDVALEKRDIISLARGGYAELLLIQQNRREEGERMKKWSESIWRNRRLSLAEALDFSESSKFSIVDTHVCRII